MSDTTRRFDRPADADLPVEHPTRRLGNRPGGDDPRPCLRCQGPMFAVGVQAGAHNPETTYSQQITLIGSVRSGGWFKRDQVNATICTALVCVACGYTELVAQTPQVLLEPEDLLHLGL